ncbi:uncharacterized protein METZ01_LOCUS190528 [marine metagenome]|uniref:Uncharacterized protein n=1 Tax=marine metagenome TaxID=408172 RepID=A0A382DI58_9ZZZZ
MGDDLSGLPMAIVSGSHGNRANRKRV